MWSPFLTIDLSLPHRVGHAPEGGQQEEGPALVGVGHPREEVGDDRGVDGGAEDEDGQAAQVPDQDAEAEGAGRVGDAVGDQDEAYVLHAVRAAAAQSIVEPIVFFARPCLPHRPGRAGLAPFTDVAGSKFEGQIGFPTSYRLEQKKCPPVKKFPPKAQGQPGKLASPCTANQPISESLSSIL